MPNPSIETMEFRCPKCQSLIYSRKPKICGQCGALLPLELLQTDEQATASYENRRWARELASKFGSQNRSECRAASAHNPISRRISLEESGSPEEMLRRVSFAEEFRHRPRPDFWIYVVGYGFTLFVMAFLSLNLGEIPTTVVLIMTVFLAGLTYRAWHRASPICPNCHQNIRFCAAIFCHLCGRALSHKRCQECSVDNSWISSLRPYANLGNFKWITYCPGCGVELDSKVPRWRFGERL